MNFLLSVSRLLADQLETISGEVNSILKTWVGPLFIAIGGVGAVYAIILGVQYAKAENDSKRAETKTRMMNCIFGVLCLLVIGTISLTVDWAGLVRIFGYAGKKSMVGML